MDDGGFVLEDVPHLTDYLPELPVIGLFLNHISFFWLGVEFYMKLSMSVGM